MPSIYCVPTHAPPLTTHIMVTVGQQQCDTIKILGHLIVYAQMSAGRCPTVKVRGRAKKFLHVWNFPPSFCPLSKAANAQPNSPDGTCITELGRNVFAWPCAAWICHPLKMSPKKPPLWNASCRHSNMLHGCHVLFRNWMICIHQWCCGLLYIL